MWLALDSQSPEEGNASNIPKVRHVLAGFGDEIIFVLPF